MRVLILGGEGMLGHKVFQILSQRFETFATFRDFDGPWTRYPVYVDVDRTRTIGGVDAVNFPSIVRAFAQVKPAVVINCIGIIKQLKEAQDPLISIELNALFPHRLAELCLASGARLLHMSTDCVFTGRKGHYTETDVADAEDLYGRTKLLGEVDRPGCLTIRTSIFGRDFVKQSALLEWFLSNRGRSVYGYTQVIYSGFPTQVLARIMGDLIVGFPELSGLYQIASEPISKYDLLVGIWSALQLDVTITPDAIEKSDRSLDVSRFLAATGYQLPQWTEMLAELASDTTPYDEWRRQYGAVGR